MGVVPKEAIEIIHSREGVQELLKVILSRYSNVYSVYLHTQSSANNDKMSSVNISVSHGQQ